MQDALQAGSALIPSLRYHDAPAAIAFLERVLGFRSHAVYHGEGGTVAHAELRHGGGMVMLGSWSNPSPHANLLAHPQAIQGRVTSPLYLVVPDCDPVWQSVQDAGAEIVDTLRTMDYGGRSFSIRDPEGYLWSVGEYDPWKAPGPAGDSESASNGA